MTSPIKNIKRKRSNSSFEDFLKQLLGSSDSVHQSQQKKSKQVPSLTPRQLQQFQEKTAKDILRGRQGHILDLIQGKVEKVVENIPASVIKEAMKKSQRRKIEYYMLIRTKPVLRGGDKHDHIEIYKVPLDKTKPYPTSMVETLQTFHFQHPELSFMDGVVAAPTDYLHVSSPPSSPPKKTRR